MKQKIRIGGKTGECHVLGHGVSVPRTGVPRKAMSGDEYHACDVATHTRLEKSWDSFGTLHGHITKPKPPTDAMILGNAIHCALLEPDEYGRRYVVGPQFNLRKSTDRDARDEFAAGCAKAGTIALNPKQRDAVAGAVDSAMKIELIRKVVEQDGHVEQSRFWIDSETELLCAARLDKYLQNGLAADIKTSDDPVKFMRTFTDLAYHRQLAHYGVGLKESADFEIAAWVALVIGNKWPHECFVQAIHQATIARGELEMVYLRRKYRAACDAREADPETWWFAQREQSLNLPGWYLSRPVETQGYADVEVDDDASADDASADDEG